MRHGIAWHQEENIAIITIDNPPANVLNPILASQLLKCLKDIEKEDSIRAVLLCSLDKKFFMAGSDVSEFPTYLKSKAGYISAGARMMNSVFSYLEDFPLPVIAAVQGIALGAGFELVLCCDLCITDKSAQFGFPEVNLGLMPGSGGTQRLPRRVGRLKAKELMFFGCSISAEEALELGLVNMIVPEGRVFEEAKKLAEKISRQPSISIRLIKESINRGSELPIEQGLKIESDLFERAFRTEDCKEGLTSYFQKRKPVFKHE